MQNPKSLHDVAIYAAGSEGVRRGINRAKPQIVHEVAIYAAGLEGVRGEKLYTVQNPKSYMR